MTSGDKVVGIDATPLPIKAPAWIDLADFSFPCGFVVEGTIYCIEEAFPRPDNTLGVRLVGTPILFRKQEVEWSSLRFRKIEEKTEESELRETVEAG